ncbi:CWF19-like protein 1 [Amphiura filiformis]|uniref:CWF19-like protein 1 n=1 Tax=Amphiura filiformis TaxID=82378 RepID=UPI003B21A8B6
MSIQPLKILVTGDVAGKFDQLFNRVRNVNKKAGPFEMLLCVGDFFGVAASAQAEWKKYQDGEEKVPMPTYILGANKVEHLKFFAEPNGCEIAENVTFLGKKGTFTGTSGLQIAYMSGIEQEDAAIKEPHHFNKADVDALGMPLVSDSKFRGVDVLLTSQWPLGVAKYASPPDGINVEGLQSTGSASVSDLVLALRPRYHFAGMEGCFYERLPYRNHKVLAEGARHVTRFLALAKVGNKEKKKYLYAFNIIPMNKMEKEELVKQPQDVTECPYSWSERKQQEQQRPDMSNQYFFSTGQHGQGSGHRGRGRGHKRSHEGQRMPPKPTGPCWFCLASPQVEKHLVVSVGTTTYLALAKGGLVPDHVLITPIGHYQSTVDLPQDVISELEQYKTALRKLFKSEGKTCVIFERNFRTQHLQIQVVPVKFDSMMVDIKDVFLEHAESHKLELNEIPRHSDLKQIVSVGAPYFYVELPNGDKLLHRVKKFFPLQFGREVLASSEILDMTERADWKACDVSKEEATDMTAVFREKFNKFDFNAADDDDED